MHNVKVSMLYKSPMSLVRGSVSEGYSAYPTTTPADLASLNGKG